MKRLRGLLAGNLLFLSTVARAAVVAVVDTGVDIGHRDIAPYVWTNPGEIPRNGIDDDGNNFVDDIHGWDFVDNNNILIAPYDHGTHVAGIVLGTGSEATRILVIRWPTSYVYPQGEKADKIEERESVDPRIEEELLKLAEGEMKRLTDVVKYISGHKVPIANLSYAIDSASLLFRSGIVALIASFFGQKLTKQQEDKLVHGFLGTLIERTEEMLPLLAPDTLFVIPAGNRAKDNDVYPVWPGNVTGDNIISVGASAEGWPVLFSNFGVKSVHLVAPGVNILSTIPRNRYSRMSGTSMSAPFVAGVAATVKEANPSLTPKQIKKILIETVTRSRSFEGFVASGGIVNGRRALYAANLSRQGDLDEAIRQSLLEVPDKNSKVDNRMFRIRQSPPEVPDKN